MIVVSSVASLKVVKIPHKTLIDSRSIARLIIDIFLIASGFNYRHRVMG